MVYETEELYVEVCGSGWLIMLDQISFFLCEFHFRYSFCFFLFSFSVRLFLR